MKKELYQLLRDEDTLLTSCELRFLDEVNDVVDSRLRSVGKYCSSDEYNEQVSNLRRKMAVLEEDVILVLKRLKEGRSARDRFLRTYPKWKSNREKCIAELKGIAESIKSDKFNCNVSKLVGYCTSAVGGGVSLVSAILIPFTLGLTTPLAIGGGVLAAAGAGTAVGTSITEITLLKSNVDKAKNLIEKDKEYFESMREWLEHASDLQEALSKVLDIEIESVSLRNIIEQVSNFVRETKAILNQSQLKKAVEKGINTIIKQLLPEFAPYSREIVEVISIIAILVAVFIVLQNTNNSVIFDCVSLTIRSILGVGSLLVSGSFDIFSLSKVLTVNAAVARNLSRAIARGAVAVVGIALDVIGIVFTSVDIHKGSLSPEAEKIAEAALKLKEEEDILDSVYVNILF